MSTTAYTTTNASVTHPHGTCEGTIGFAASAGSNRSASFGSVCLITPSISAYGDDQPGSVSSVVKWAFTISGLAIRKGLKPARYASAADATSRPTLHHVDRCIKPTAPISAT